MTYNNSRKNKTSAKKYEIDDISFIEVLNHKKGIVNQYDVLLAARGYGWESMKSWAEYMINNELDISHGTLCVAPIAGSEDIELIDKYHSTNNIMEIPELKKEWGVLSVGGISKCLKQPIRIFWYNQTQVLQVFTTINDETLMRRYIETVIRRTFGTPDEMKLAKPVPKSLDSYKWFLPVIYTASLLIPFCGLIIACVFLSDKILSAVRFGRINKNLTAVKCLFLFLISFFAMSAILYFCDR